MMDISAQNWYYYAMAAVAIAGALFAAYKLRPESTKIFVETAKVTLDMANDARDDLEEKLAKVSERLNDIEGAATIAKRRADNLGTEVKEARERADHAEQRADELSLKVAEADERANRAAQAAEDLKKDLEDERTRVKELIRVVVLLQEELRNHHIEIPPHLNIPDVKRLEGD